MEFLGDDSSTFFEDLLSVEDDEGVTLLRRPVVRRNGVQSSIEWKNVEDEGSSHQAGFDVLPDCFGHTAVLTQDKDIVICYGGRDEFEYFGDIWELHLATSTWKKISRENGIRSAVQSLSSSSVTSSTALGIMENSSTFWPSPRTGHSACMVGEKMFVLSGEVGAGVYSRELLFWDVRKRKWNVECAVMSCRPRKGHTMHYLPHQNTLGRSLQDLLVVFGGNFTDGSYTNELLLYFFDTKSWSRLQVKGTIPEPRAFHVSQLLPRSPFLVVFGGQGQVDISGTTARGDESVAENSHWNPSVEKEYFNSLYVLDVSLGVWRRVLATNTPSPRSCACSVFENEELAVFCGGASGSYATDILQLHLSSPTEPDAEVVGSWKALAIHGTPQCSCSAVVCTDTQLLLIGGIFEKQNIHSCRLSLSLGRLFLASSLKIFQLQAHRMRKAKKTAAHLLAKREKLLRSSETEEK